MQSGQTPGYRTERTAAGTVVTARVGRPDAAAFGALMLAAGWLVLCLVVLSQAIGSEDAGDAALRWVSVFALGLGLYFAALAVWSMFGIERLEIGGEAIRVTNPWTFGLARRRFNLAHVQGVVTGCDGHAEDTNGCCCRIPTNEHALALLYRGRRRKIFSQLSADEKERFRLDLAQLISEYRQPRRETP